MADFNTQEIPERRHFTRIPFDTDFCLYDPRTDGVWNGKIVDLSLKGALIDCPQKMEPRIDEEYVLELTLNEDALKVIMLVSIAHITDDRLGFRCHHIDLESLGHLRKTLETRLDKPEMVEREVSEMLHIAIG